MNGAFGGLFDFNGKIVEEQFEANKDKVSENKVVKNLVDEIKNDDTEIFLDYKETISFYFYVI